MDDSATGHGLSRRGVLGALSALGVAGACDGQAGRSGRSGISLGDFLEGGGTDHSAALQRAIAAGNGTVHIPDGTYVIDKVVGADVRLYGRGTLRKKPGTKGVMLYLSGSSRIEGLTLDYGWPDVDPAPPFVNNITIYQRKGELHLIGVTCRRSFYAAVYVEGASLVSDANCSFLEGIPHNGQGGNSARPSYYIVCVSDSETRDETINISGGRLIGSSLEQSKLHLNPTGIFITPSKLDGTRFKSINISNTTLIGCSTNCGNGNVTGAVDIYNGAENITISGLTIRLFTYAAIKVQNSSNFNIFGNTASDGFVPAGAYLQAACGCITTQRVRGSTTAQSGGQVWHNVFTGMCYAGIINSCDHVSIAGNLIKGVRLAKLGSAIENSGDHVQMIDNIATAIEGVQISSSGNDCRMEGNDMDSGAIAGRAGATFSGRGAVIRRNRFRSGRMSGGSGIRTDGPASEFDIRDNVIEGFPYGVDIRATAGPVRDGLVGDNRLVGGGMPRNVSPAAVGVRVESP